MTVVRRQPARVCWLPWTVLALSVLLAAIKEWRGATPFQMGDLQVYLGGGRAALSPRLYDMTFGPGRLPFTYPPLSAFLLAPLGLLPLTVTKVVWRLAMVAALLVLVRLTVRRTIGGWPAGAQWGLSALLTAAAWWLLPVRITAFQGQINLFLAAAVAGDLLVLGRRGSRWAGVGVGLAAALKITPALFVVHLLAIRQWRAGTVAVATGLGLTALAAAMAPQSSWRYFTVALWDPTRVGGAADLQNQSINGLLARVAFPGGSPRVLYLALAMVVAVAGLSRARLLCRRGDLAAGMTVTGLVALAISPVSWEHHAVWVVPALIILVDGARPGGGRGPTIPRSVGVGVWTASRWHPGLLALAASGAVLWVVPTTMLSGLPIVPVSSIPWFRALLAGSPTLWYLVVICLLPARPAGASSVGAE